MNVPRRLFDAVRKYVDSYGGIGADDFIAGNNAPLCAVGFARAIGRGTGKAAKLPAFVRVAFGQHDSNLFGVYISENDSIVHRLLQGTRKRRVPFAVWANAVGVKRA